MRSPKFTTLVALSMLTASTSAVAQSAPSANSTARAGVETQDANELRGTTAWFLAAIALGLIVWGIIKLTDNDTNAVPLSP